MGPPSPPTIRVCIGDADAPIVNLRRRMAWALRALMASGERGCTYLDTPAPRWAVYVHNRRTLGFVIETRRERHCGPFAGYHARYVLRSSVVILGHSGGPGLTKHAKPSAVVRNGKAGNAISHLDALQTALEQAPLSVKAALEHAIAVSENGYKKALDAMD